MPSSQLHQLRSVFGPLTQNPPEQRDQQPVEPEPEMAADDGVPGVLPAQPVFHHKTEVVLVPSRRIDGSELDAPWNLSEQEAWNWLRTTSIEHLDEQLFDGTDGMFLAWCRSDEGELRATYLRFDTIGYETIYDIWAREYTLSPDAHDPLRREQAAYEVAKAMGCEDMVPPIAAKEVNLVPLISDAVRDRVAAKYKMAPLLVDETYGIIAALQFAPLNATNFVEYWATLGADWANRFDRASPALRHSIFRLIALDFVLGTGCRSLSDLVYNESTGVVAVFGMGVTFPDPLASADIYLEQRAAGWGRRLPLPTEDPIPGAPPSAVDTVWISKHFEERQVEECLATFKQISDGLTPEVCVLLAQALSDIGVPRNNIANFLARVAFLAEDPESVIVNQFDFVRSILVPMRRGYGFEEGRNGQVVHFVNEVMMSAFQDGYDFTASMQEQVEQEPQQ
jgi:hypothetical protein